MLATDSALENPNLIAFIPFLYLAWADADLTEQEINDLREAIMAFSWLTDSEREYLYAHLNPEQAPSPHTLKGWQRIIRQHADQLSDDLKSTLATTGLKLADVHTQNVSPSGAIKDALERVESQLGVLSRESPYHIQRKAHPTQTNELNTTKSFDPQIIRDALEGDEQATIEQVKALLVKEEFDFVSPYISVEQYREQVLKWCKILADQGLGNTAYPTEYGGEDDIKKYFTVMETLSYHDLSMVIKFGVQFGLWGMSVLYLGTKKHHDQYLRPIGKLELPGCFAMTETGHGSNVKGLETTATYDHQEGMITIHSPNEQAGKEYIGNAAVHGQMATVFAKLVIEGVDYGVNAFIVPLRNQQGELLPGIRIEDNGHKMGLNGVDNGRIWFDKVKIDRDAMLDRYASIDDEGKFNSQISSDNRRFFVMLSTLVGGRVGIARSALSAAKTGLTIAIRYAEKRKQFGPENGQEVPILNYRTHQRRLLPLLASTYACHFALRYLTQRFLSRTKEDIKEVEALAAGLKAWSTWNTTRTLQECREALGGKGYLSENRIDRLKNDTDIYTTFEGDNTVLMQLVAKSRLAEFRKEFADINFFGMVNYIADKARINIAEKNPLAVRETSSEHLLDHNFHLKAFRYREMRILKSAATRFKHYIDKGMDSFDAFNQTQYHMLKVGFAYIERVILEQFVERIQQVEDKNSRETLTKVCQLFALTQIEQHKGWYLENGYMEGVKTKAIRKEVNQLCWELRKEASGLVEAFGIPEKLLPALIKDD
ncbi:acyl-CoA dehydrogenase [Catalinimonas sp. 4WD22]|uniref:acyl-CoA dehydrogenase family protein n=1 Tax=Catalinimonas locisalis TaxID=3133978 RepID=UPI003100C6D4